MSSAELIVSDLHASLSQLDCNGVPSTRFRHAACICGDYLYVHGGRSGYRALRDFWRLNLKIPSWEPMRLSSSTTHRPGLLEDHLMVSYDGKVILLGNGSDSLNRSEMQIWIFQPELLSWIRPPIPKDPACRIPLGRRSATGTVAGHKLYLVGGIVDLYAKATAELVELDLEQNSWKSVETEGTLIVPPVYEHSTVAQGGLLYVFGGMRDQKVQNSLWTFHINKKTWNRVLLSGRVPPARCGHSAIVAFGSMFVHGGQNEQVILGDVWRFDFFCEIWTKISMSESSFISHHVALWLPNESASRISCAPGDTSQRLPLDLTENHFSETNSVSDSRIRSDSQEYLIPEGHHRNVPELQYSYNNDAIEMEAMGSRKMTRNLSASSEKRSKEKSKKQKSQEEIRSLTSREHFSGNQDGAIELDLLSSSPGSLKSSTSGATGGTSVPESSRKPSPTMMEVRKMGKLLLVGGDSNQEPVTFKRSMRITVVEIPDINQI